MRFSLTTILALVAATAVSAANVLAEAPGNAISYPSAGDEVVAGKPIDIVWNPSEGDEVTLVLRKGDTENLDTVEIIADDIPNEGTYEWTPPATLAAGEDYAIEIRWGGEEDYESNYSPKFAVDSNVKEVTTTAVSSTTAASTTATVTDTKTETITGSTTMVTSTVLANSTSTSSSSPTRSSSARPSGSGEPVIPSDDKGAAGKVGISMLAVAAAAVAYFA